MNNSQRVAAIQRNYFAILAEFFQRATGDNPSEFASFDSFGVRIRSEAHKLALRAPNAFSYAHESLSKFYTEYGIELFTEAKKLGGLSFVLGGSTRFHQSQFDSVRKVALYADTILIPDPILPWIEDPRREERFRNVLFLETALTLLHLKPLVDADLPYPAILVFPSYEKSLERMDPTTEDRIKELLSGTLSVYLRQQFAGFEELVLYARENEADFLRVVDENHLVVAPGGEIGQPLPAALDDYLEEIKEWRSEEHISSIVQLPRGLVALNALMERIAPQYHLLENAEELSSCPMLCLPVHWHYYQMTSRFFDERLRSSGALSESAINTMRGINQPDLKWLGNIPVEVLAELRRNNENEEFRRSLKARTSELHGAAVGDLERVTTEISRAISSLLVTHDKQVAAIQEKYQTKYRNLAIGSWVSLAATLMPALAPFVGAIAPVALGTTYISTKIEERKERAKTANSLIGILAAAKKT